MTSTMSKVELPSEKLHYVTSHNPPVSGKLSPPFLKRIIR